MFMKIVAFCAFLAAANAHSILLPSAKIGSFPVTKTTIEGPSGHITQEEHLPVLTHDPIKVVDTPVVRLHSVPLVQHHEVVSHEVLPLHPVVHHEVHHELPLIDPVPSSHVVIKTLVPHVVPHVRYTVPHYYKTFSGW